MSAPLPAVKPLRDYQVRACAEVEACWNDTGTAAHARAVCLVAPTGSGKTRMGAELALRTHISDYTSRILWVTHRTELLDQSRTALDELGLDTGVLSAGFMDNTEADTIVASWQTLVSRATVRPAADLVIIDECHHVAADEWRTVLDAYPDARILGLTATPQRKDGRPLGDIFTALVVAAQYSELIRAGHLVPCRLRRPTESLGTNLAKEPLAAYQEYAAGKSCIVFTRTIEAADKLAAEFTEAGYPAECISADTPALTRAEHIDSFKAGELRVLTCVFTLTEGFDHPATEACLLARGCQHTGTYLQMVGRVLRPAPGKTEALVIDLPGVSWIHGIPTEDRQYRLDGKSISSSAALRVCPECGYTWEPNGDSTCPSCGWEPEKVEPPKPRIYDMDLEEVYAGADTPDDAKSRELARLRRLASERGWSLGFVAKEYEKLFGERPSFGDASDAERMTELRRLREIAAKKGYKEGWAAYRYKALFGRWPPRLPPIAAPKPPEEDWPF